MAADADRHLLFGLLALQNGFIQQAQLVAAFHAWTCDKSRSLADHLISLGHLTAAQRSVVEALAALHVEAHGGDVEKSLAAVPAGRSTQQDLAGLNDPDIEATLGHVASGHGKTNDGDSDRTGSYAIGTATSEGQRFRVLRPHARGGLGAVFVALDAELNREVALKQILERHADDANSRQRFLLEAEVTGGLEHPGIVPVYGLGTYADGRPYYAMRFIRGDSLKEAIDRFHADASKKDAGVRSLELRKLLRRFLDVCNAIDYAHSRGVIHRDIKPANIIVGKHGETLVVDWGLAKATGHSEPGAAERTLVPGSTSGSSETLPGSALGTPAYMSPEQARGELDRLGPRSDVYSLGATLYCLLTGRPAFEGDDIGAILREVQKGEFPPPRRHDASIDAALEAVCLKAMANRPEDRYATPRQLADDLERWMADEPVTAWREPWTRTLTRWLARHRTGVTAAGAALLVALAGTGAVLAVQTRSNQQLKSANNALAAANQKVTEANTDLAEANQRERARFELAQEAIRTYYTGVSEDLLLKQKEFDALRTKLLRGAREFYQRLEGLLEGRKDRESRVALGRAYHDVGELTSMIGTIEEAMEVHRRGLDLFEGLGRDAPEDPEVRYEIARGSKVIGGLLLSTGRNAESLTALDRARTILRALAEASSADDRTMLALAEVEHYFGAALHEAGRHREALEAYEKARTILEALVAANPSAERVRLDLASICESLGLYFKDVGRDRESSLAFDRARALSEALMRANPTDPKFAHELARTLGNWTTSIPSDAGKPQVTSALERALKALEAAGEANPTNLAMQADLAWIGTLIAHGLVIAGRDAEALAACERALAAREKLAKANPTLTRHIEQQVHIHVMIAQIHLRAGRLAGARASCQNAIAIGERGVKAHPSVPSLFEQLAYAYQPWIEFLVARGENTEALAATERMRAIVARLVEIHPSTPRGQSRLADYLRRRGIVLQAIGRISEAIDHYRRSLAILEKLEKPTPIDLYDMACCRSLIAGASAEAGSGVSLEEGRVMSDQAVAGVRRACEAGYTNLRWIRIDDPDLKPIRSRPDFQVLMMDLTFPADPFSP